MNDIATRCIDIIAKSKSIPADSISLANTFDELNIDSLDKINISFEVEEAFNIEIPDEALSTLRHRRRHGRRRHKTHLHPRTHHHPLAPPNST